FCASSTNLTSFDTYAPRPCCFPVASAKISPSLLITTRIISFFGCILFESIHLRIGIFFFFLKAHSKLFFCFIFIYAICFIFLFYKSSLQIIFQRHLHLCYLFHHPFLSHAFQYSHLPNQCLYPVQYFHLLLFLVLRLSDKHLQL